MTYANEWEDYTVSEEALNDASFRDDLIALGLNPETGQGKGQLSALIFDGGRNTTGSLLDARNGYYASVHLEQAGGWLGGAFDYSETPARDGSTRRSATAPSSPCGRAPARSIRPNPETLRAVLQALLPRRRHQPARLGPLRGRAA